MAWEHKNQYQYTHSLSLSSPTPWLWLWMQGQLGKLVIIWKTWRHSSNFGFMFLVVVLLLFCKDMKKGYSVSWKNKHWNEPFFASPHTKTRQHQCIQQNNHSYSIKLATFTPQNTLLPHALVALLLLVTSIGNISPALCHPITVSGSGHPLKANQTLRAGVELLKLRRIRAQLKKINKPAVKTIQVFPLYALEDVTVCWQCLYAFILRVVFLVICSKE